MDCPKCKNKLKVAVTVQEKSHICRILKCNNCDLRFTSEEVLYDISSKKGDELKQMTYRLKHEQNKLNAAMVKLRSKTKEKRKVTGPPKPVKEGEVYLTYGEIFKKFKEQYPDLEINDWRPYPLLDHSIIVWLEGSGLELAYQYWPKWGNFCLIERAKKYEQILDEAWRKKA